MPAASPLPRALVEAYDGTPPWRRLAAWGVVFALGLVLVAFAYAARPQGWSPPAMAVGGVMMVASVVAVAFNLPRRATKA